LLPVAVAAYGLATESQTRKQSELLLPFFRADTSRKHVTDTV